MFLLGVDGHLDGHYCWKSTMTADKPPTQLSFNVSVRIHGSVWAFFQHEDPRMLPKNLEKSKKMHHDASWCIMFFWWFLHTGIYWSQKSLANLCSPNFDIPCLLEKSNCFGHPKPPCFVKRKFPQRPCHGTPPALIWEGPCWKWASQNQTARKKEPSRYFKDASIQAVDERDPFEFLPRL